MSGNSFKDMKGYATVIKPGLQFEIVNDEDSVDVGFVLEKGSAN